MKLWAFFTFISHVLIKWSLQKERVYDLFLFAWVNWFEYETSQSSARIDKTTLITLRYILARKGAGKFK